MKKKLKTKLLATGITSLILLPVAAFAVTKSITTHRKHKYWKKLLSRFSH